VKVCDLTQFYSPVSGGVKRYVQEKVNYIRQHTAADSHVLIIPGAKDERIVEDRATVYTIASPLLSRTSRYRALWRLEAIEDILVLEKPDIIESGDPYQVAWKAVASGHGLGIPVVGFYHSHFPEAYVRSATRYFGKTASEFMMDVCKRYVRSLYNRFAYTMVPSPALGRVLEEWGVENVSTIDLGVDTDIFHPNLDDGAETRENLQIPCDRMLLLYIGRLAKEKNTRTLFEAFRLLSQNYPAKYHLLVVGDGLQRSAIQDLQAETKQVTWLSYCGDPLQLARIYRSADLFVHPGVQETFGLVTLESQACGTPVVGIRGSYMDRIIFNDQRHWAAKNDDASLAEAIHTVAAGNLKPLGREASEAVRTKYSWQLVFDRLFGIYRNAIASYKPFDA
jgi:alpha-1,6-mannosyltransferase